MYILVWRRPGGISARSALLCFAFTTCVVPVACAQDPALSPANGGPTVGEAVKPGTARQDLRTLPTTKTYQPGDPVYEMPDLRESEGRPRVSEPVDPKTSNRKIEKGPAPRPAATGPPRVMPDLKESPPSPGPEKRTD